MNRRAFPIIKSILSPDCKTTSNNDTCNPWRPFQGSPKDDRLLGLLDFTFTATYAFSIFISGYLSQRIDQRLFLTFGMVLASLSTVLFGLIRPLAIHSLPYMFVIQLLNGMTQSTGLPAVTEIVGVWISKSNPGVIFGIWSSHQFIGNIIGNLICGAFLHTNWSFSFFVPASVMLFMAGINFCLLPSHPGLVDININQKSEKEKASCAITSNDEGTRKQSDETYIYIDFLKALLLPSVIEFCICLFFTKFIVYTLFFWLPYILVDLVHNAKEAANLASLNDIGNCIGGILAGILYDVTDSPGFICVYFLICGVPSMYILFVNGISATAFVVLAFFAGCFFGGTFVLITSALTKRPSTSQQLSYGVRSIATLAAIYDGFGSLGASVGPLVTGFLRSGKSWQNESYLLTVCAVISALSLARQFVEEVLHLHTKRKGEKMKDDNSSETEYLLINNDKETID